MSCESGPVPVFPPGEMKPAVKAGFFIFGETGFLFFLLLLFAGMPGCISLGRETGFAVLLIR